MGSDSMKKAYIESTRRGVFGTTAARIKPMTKSFEPEVPGPAHYQVKEKPFAPRYQQMSSNFASMSNRIKDPADPVKVGTIVQYITVADSGFPIGGRRPHWGANLRNFSAEMSAKTKELGPVGGGSHLRKPPPPKICHCIMVKQI